MIMFREMGSTYTFMMEPNDVGSDGDELVILKARTVKGVKSAVFNNGVCIVHMQKLNRGPLRCEQELEEAFA